jgi:hypothetical protein
MMASAWAWDGYSLSHRPDLTSVLADFTQAERSHTLMAPRLGAPTAKDAARPLIRHSRIWDDSGAA